MSEQDPNNPPEGSNAEPEKPLAEKFSEHVSSAAKPPPPASTALGLGKMPVEEEKTMGMLAHILGGITCIVGPLIIWLLKKDESPFVDDQGKEALNFQITMGIGYLICAVIGQIPFVGCIAWLVYAALLVTSLVFAIMGGLAANRGEVHRYPFALRFVK